MTSHNSSVEHLKEENDRLKSTVRSQDDKIKLLATKLVKYLKKGDEEKCRISELECQVSSLKEKLTLYRTQLESQTQLSSFGRSRSPRVHSGSGVNNATTGTNGSISIETLLLEAKAENQAHENKIAILKQILEEKESEIERLESVNNTKSVTQTDTKKLEENIKLIRLNREKRKASSWLSTLESQCSSLQSECNKARHTISELETEVSDWNDKVNELQERNLSLEKRLGEVATFKFSGKESENVISTLQSEVKILKSRNDQLTAKLEAKKTVSEPKTTVWKQNEQILELEKRLKAECEKNAELVRVESTSFSNIVVVEEDKGPLRVRAAAAPLTKETTVQTALEAPPQQPCQNCQANASDLSQTQWQLVQLRDELGKIRILLDTQIFINRDLIRDLEEKRKQEQEQLELQLQRQKQ